MILLSAGNFTVTLVPCPSLLSMCTFSLMEFGAAFHQK